MLLCFVLKVEIKEQIKEQIMVRLNLYTGISENIARSLDLHMFYSFPCSSFLITFLVVSKRNEGKESVCDQ